MAQHPSIIRWIGKKIGRGFQVGAVENEYQKKRPGKMKTGGIMLTTLNIESRSVYTNKFPKQTLSFDSFSFISRTLFTQLFARNQI